MSTETAGNAHSRVLAIDAMPVRGNGTYALSGRLGER
jgi:hypothetical protein